MSFYNHLRYRLTSERGNLLDLPNSLSRRTYVVIFVIIIFVWFCASYFAGATHYTSTSINDAQFRIGPYTSQSLKALRELPLNFELNQGQADPKVKFLAHGITSEIYLTSAEIIFNLRRPIHETADRNDIDAPKVQDKLKTAFKDQARQQNKTNSRNLVKMKLVGGNKRARIEGLDELPETVNYFIGKNRKSWHTDIQTYRKVIYRDVYPGIDQVFYGNEQHLEYDFLVAPGANPRTIGLSFTGLGNPNIDQQGDVVWRLRASEEMRLHKPLVYQQINGTKVAVPAGYVIRAKGEIGFELGPYDTTQSLIIDPILSYATYFGGSGNDVAFGIAVDSSGNPYITGSTDSNELSTLPNTNVFVMKLNASATQREYLSIIGGSGDETGFDITVDGSGSAFVTGATSSTNFPSLNGVQSSFGGGVQDAFVIKLNPGGSGLVYSTYLGGSGNDAGFGMTVDGSSNAYLTGSSDSVEFSSLGGTNAFVAKLNAEGNQRTYLSILGGSEDDLAFSIAVDNSGHAYITGSTNSKNFTTANPLQPSISGPQDAFIAKLNPSGSALVFSTYFGSSGTETGFDLIVDSAGNSYVTGVTNSPELSNLGGTDAFLVKFNAAGTERLYFSVLGGDGDDVGLSIGLDSANNAYLTGTTNSSNFPTASPLQTSTDGKQAFVAKFDATGSSLLFSSLLGGSGDDEGFGIAIHSDGAAYITGFTSSNDFPTLNPLQAANGGKGDAFILKIVGLESTPTPSPTVTPTATPTPSPQPSIQLLRDQSGPAVDQVAALDSMLFLRDPFPVVNAENVLNQGPDRNTRLIIFVTNLQLAQGETSSAVVVNLVSASDQNFDISAEDVRQVPTTDIMQITFRLPTGLVPGTCTIKVKAHGQVSNTGTMRIRS